jgi:aminodeoxyfutalosine deaminase
VSVSPAERRWLHGLPKVELHCHLEGSMSVDTVRALIDRHGADPTPVWPDGLPDAFSFDGFPSFARQFWFGMSLIRSGDDLATITDDLATTLAAQNVRYAELTSTAYTHLRGYEGVPGMSPAEYRQGLDDGRRRAVARGVEIGWVIDIPRDLEMPHETVTVDYITGPHAPEGLVALGLGGYEVGFPAAPYAEHFARARAFGLPGVPHAGETEGPESVRQALHDLGAVRIGHGIRAIEDAALVAELAERRVMLEVCPSSNLKLWVYDSVEQHPFPALRQAGVRVCLNTDDPGWFAGDLMTELELASEHFAVAQADHVAMQLDAVDASFAPADLKTALTGSIGDYGTSDAR